MKTSEMAETVRLRMARMVSDWKAGTEASDDVSLDIWYDDSKPYFTRVPWKGGMAFEGDDGVSVPLELSSSWALNRDRGALEEALRNAYSTLKDKAWEADI